MEEWEFLIQKEGDRSWLSVESPEVEILEGRYRMVARCSRNNVPVEIRAIYQSSEEFPPKRRMQKRGTRTNAEGLMVVIPFTRLKPGFWDFTCFLDQTTQGSIRVEVLSIEEEGGSDFSGGLTSAGFEEGTESDREEEFSELEGVDRLQAAAEAVAEDEAAGVVPEENPVIADPSPPGKLYAFPDRISPVAEGSRTSPPPVPPSPPQAQPQKLPPLQLVLQQETYMVKWGKVLTLEGRIEAVDGKAGDRISGLELGVMLQNPQTGAKIVEVELPLSEGTLPMQFTCPVEIPEQTKSHLLLGEVSLSDGSGTRLRARSFTITADLDDLLGAISPDLSEEKLLEHSRESIHQQNLEDIDASFDEILETIQKSQPISFEPSGNQVLPPQIVKPQAKSPQAGKPLDLPTFKRPQVSPPVEEVKPPEPAIATPAEPETPSTSVPVPQELPTTPEETKTVVPSPEVKSAPDPVAKKGSPVDQAFKSLHLQDRFFSRLNALAGDRELSDWLKISFTPVSDESEDNPFEMDEELSDENYPERSRRKPPEPEEIDWEAREIVVDDELLAEASVAAVNAKSEGAALLLLPEDQPVPNPRLSLPKGELSAGRSVKVTVQLPQMLPRIYVKLWVLDRQSRTVLDGPHWLTQFWPTGFGDVEGSRELMVPYGSLQVQFEAIAVEMQTQRESHKVSLERQISPPSPPSLPL